MEPVICVVAEAENGARFYRDIQYITNIAEIDDDGEWIVRKSHSFDEAFKQAQTLADRLEGLQTPSLRSSRWNFAGSVYGSPLYQQLENAGLLVD